MEMNNKVPTCMYINGLLDNKPVIIRGCGAGHESTDGNCTTNNSRFSLYGRMVENVTSCGCTQNYCNNNEPVRKTTTTSTTTATTTIPPLDETSQTTELTTQLITENQSNNSLSTTQTTPNNGSSGVGLTYLFSFVIVILLYVNTYIR